MKPGSKADARSDSAADGESAPDEKAIEFERLRRSVRVINALLRAIADSRRLLKQLAAPFLEIADEKDSQKKISEQKRRRRDAVFAAAKNALDPEHPIKKSVDESLGSLDDLDVAIASNVREVKSKVLEKLDDLIKHALQDANAEKSAESVEQFTGKAQTLLTEMDVHSQELRIVQKMCKAQLQRAWITRLATTRNIAIASVLLIAVAIGSAGYALKTRKQPDVANPAAQVVAPAVSSKKESAAVPPKTEPAPAKIAPLDIAPNPLPASIVQSPVPTKPADSKPSPKPPQTAQSGAKFVGGTATLTTGQSREQMKKSVQALSEVIKEWNAENEAQEKAQKKATRQ